MTDSVTKSDFTGMVVGAAEQIRQHHALLSELDSASGDGDHGSAMLRCVERMERAFSSSDAPDIKACLRQAGWEVMDADGGASSALLGCFFVGMADGVSSGAHSLDCAGLVAVFESGLQAVCKQTKARPGDKTLMDALIPAIEAMRASAAAGKDCSHVVEAAAAAAKEGANSTTELTARFGRARHLGERCIGHRDPGAVSIAFLFEGFCQGLSRSTRGASHGRQ